MMNAVRRSTAVLTAFAAALIAVPPTASAVTRDRAVAAALNGAAPPGTAVYATPRPLARGARVAEAGPGAWSVGRPRSVRRNGQRLTLHRLRPWRVARRAWLVWHDLAPGAEFEHAGRLVLVDDRSGRVLARRRTSWWPRVNGRDARGFGSTSRKFALSAVTGAPKAVAAQTGEPPPPDTRPRPVLGDDCLVTIGDRRQPEMAELLGELKQWALSLHMPVYEARSVPELTRRATQAQLGGCKDVVIAVVAHGSNDGPTGKVRLKWTQEEDTWEQRVIQPFYAQYLTADDVARVVAGSQRRGTKFKIVVNSCFSGRWAPLAKQPGVEVVATSAGPDEVSFGAGMSPFTEMGTKLVNGRLVPGTGPPVGGPPDPYGGILNAIINGTIDTLPKVGNDLARAIFEAAKDPAYTVAARLGLTHPHVEMGVSGRVITSQYTRVVVDNPFMSDAEVIGSVLPNEENQMCSPPWRAQGGYCGIKCGPFAQFCEVELANGAGLGLGVSSRRNDRTAVLDCPQSDEPPRCFFRGRPGRAVTVTVRLVE
jgi:hypothetical protein